MHQGRTGALVVIIFVDGCPHLHKAMKEDKIAQTQAAKNCVGAVHVCRSSLGIISNACTNGSTLSNVAGIKRA